MLLTDLFPRQTRRKEIREIEKELALHLNALRHHYVLTYSLIVVLIISIVGLFFKWQLGLAFSVVGFWVAEKTANEFKDKTVRRLIDRMTRLNYFKSRRESGTVNVKEVHNKIEKLFCRALGTWRKNDWQRYSYFVEAIPLTKVQTRAATAQLNASKI
jgi:hypothetical protein